jgi:hypothetical protein
MSSMSSDRVPFLWWAVQLIVVEIIGAVAWAVIDNIDVAHIQIEDLAVGAIMCAPVNFVIFGFSMVFWVPWMKPKSKTVQEAALVGHKLLVLNPKDIRVDLDESYAAEVGRHEKRWSIRLLLDDGELLTLTVLSTREELVDERVGPLTQPEHWMGRGTHFEGAVENQEAFGDALLKALTETVEHNRFARWEDRLASCRLETASTPRAVVLDPDDSDEGGLPYRTRRPSPEQSGFSAWAKREGYSPVDGVTLSMEFLVVDSDDGRRIAFPLGATTARDAIGCLSLISINEADEQVEACVPIVDRGLSVALVRRLEEMALIQRMKEERRTTR